MSLLMTIAAFCAGLFVGAVLIAGITIYRKRDST